jgi:hypothetical protein
MTTLMSDYAADNDANKSLYGKGAREIITGNVEVACPASVGQLAGQTSPARSLTAGEICAVLGWLERN